MKKLSYSLILLLLFGSNQVSAQAITNISIYPAIPTDNDSILIMVECMFPSGTCDQHSQDFIITGNAIDAWALHCLGMLTVICPHTDTFSVGVLNPGNYIFTFQLDAGGLPFPCTPGIIAGPSATFSFEVGSMTSIDNPLTDSWDVKVFPSPVNTQLNITSELLSDETTICIYDMSGKKILETTAFNDEVALDCSAFSNGLYLAEIRNALGWQRKQFVVHHD